MNLREQVAVLIAHRVEFVVVGGQAAVLRQAIEFSHDLDVIIRATPDNAERVRSAVREITRADPDVGLVLGRDFQQYVDPDSGTEIDIHLKLISIPDFETAMRNASPVDLLGLPVTALELPALYASKRTDRPRDALHRQAIEDRLRRLVLDGAIEIDEVILACCLDREVAAREDVTGRLRDLAGRTRQPLLQTRLLALGLGTAELLANPDLHPTVRSLAALDTGTRSKLVDHPARFAALLARIPLVLPDSGHHVREKGV